MEERDYSDIEKTGREPSDPAGPLPPEGESGKAKRYLVWLSEIALTLLVVLVLNTVVLRLVLVEGNSMYPSLHHRDFLIVQRLGYRPEQGDIVVIKTEEDSPLGGEQIVKRVIATEGQTVDIDFDSGIVYVDGTALEEPYLNQKTNNDEGTVFPLTVEENCIFVLGDNRAVSLDSRSPQIGQIDRREVLGKALYLLIPGTHRGQYPPDYGRIGTVK